MDSTRRYRISEIKKQAANRNALPKILVLKKFLKISLIVFILLFVSWLVRH